MGLIDRIFGKQKQLVGLKELSKIISSGDWSEEALLSQYEKSLYVYAAVNKIAQKVASIDLRFYEIKDSKGTVKELPVHPVLDLLYRPNPYQTRSEFWKITTINKKLTGEAFWLKVRDRRGVPVELWNLRPDLMTVVTDPEIYIKHYELTKENGEIVSFDRDDIIHFKEPNPLNTFRGFSPLRAAKSRIETEQHATNFQRNFFLNNARPDALLLSDDELAPEQRSEMLASWNAKHKGKNKNSRVGILEGGVQYQQISVTQKEMDYIESLKFTKDDILVAFGVPKSVITTDDVNLANANSGLKSFLSETIKPEITDLAEVINEMLVIPDFGERYYVDFEDPTPVDREMQLKEYEAGYGKWLTANEIRKELNRDPIEGGDVLAQPQNGAKSDRPNPNQPDPQKIFRGRGNLLKQFELFEAVTKDFKVKKEKSKQSLLTGDLRTNYKALINKKIDRRAEKFQKQVNTAASLQMKRIIANLDKSVDMWKTKSVVDFDKKAENKLFAELALPFLAEAAKEAGQEALDLVGLGESFDFTERIEKLLKERAKFFAESVNDTTLEKLSKTISEGLANGEGIAKLTDRIKNVYQEFSDYRAESIARTESTAANNEGFLEAYTQSTVVNSYEWVSTNDLRTRSSHANIDGQIVEVGKKFSNGLRYPGEAGGRPEETVNCRCVISPSV
jgi:HK97 family phage portal protein